MALEVIDETNHTVICMIPNGGAALLGIDGSADPIHLLAISGNVLFRNTGIVNTNLVRAGAPLPTTGTVVADGSGIATVPTSVGQPVVAASADTLTSTQFTLRSSAGFSTPYIYW